MKVCYKLVFTFHPPLPRTRGAAASLFDQSDLDDVAPVQSKLQVACRRSGGKR